MFIKNQWYVAGSSNEVGRDLIDRTLLNERVVIYRSTIGDPIILANRCPHRFAPLSDGTLIGDELQCGYHGLRFDCTGKCTHVPGQDRIPERAVVKRYAATERYGFVWMWYGDESLADESKLPHIDAGPGFEHATNPKWATIEGYLNPKVNYQLIIDNLLDLSHVAFVHAKSFKVGVPERVEVKVEASDCTVTDRRSLFNVVPSPMLADYVKCIDGLADSWNDMYWAAPSHLLLDIGMTTPGNTSRTLEDGAVSLWSSHMITPETETTSHYFWTLSREFDVGNEQYSAMRKKIVEAAFMEDEAIIAGVQKAMDGELDLFAHQPLFLKADASAAHARRIIARMLEEQAEA